MAKIMAVNAGSSSLKFKLYEMPEELVIASGIYERIGHEDGIFQIKYKNGRKLKEILPLKNHSVAVEHLLRKLLILGVIDRLEDINGIGHRIVQGGKYFTKTVEFTPETASLIESLIPLAPLHNQAHLVGFNAFKEKLPNVYESATFDTAFHQTMTEEDYMYPIPYHLTVSYDIRRYGAHGTSHRFVSETAIKKYFNGKAEGTKIISCHLGSGASITAIKDGKCVATSMGLTPLGGIMMGTRTGDLDPSVMNYICQQTKMSVEDVYQTFNKQSGFLGLTGISNDTRDVLAAYERGNKRAIIAVKLWARRAADFIGQYFVRLGGCDMIIFTAGIGENAPFYRKIIMDNLKEALGLEYDDAANNAAIGIEYIISKPTSKIKVLVLPTDEEVMIAKDCYNGMMGQDK